MGATSSDFNEAAEMKTQSIDFEFDTAAGVLAKLREAGAGENYKAVTQIKTMPIVSLGDNREAFIKASPQDENETGVGRVVHYNINVTGEDGVTRNITGFAYLSQDDMNNLGNHDSRKEIDASGPTSFKVNVEIPVQGNQESAPGSPEKAPGTNDDLRKVPEGSSEKPDTVTVETLEGIQQKIIDACEKPDVNAEGHVTLNMLRPVGDLDSSGTGVVQYDIDIDGQEIKGIAYLSPQDFKTITDNLKATQVGGSPGITVDPNAEKSFEVPQSEVDKIIPPEESAAGPTQTPQTAAPAM